MRWLSPALAVLLLGTCQPTPARPPRPASPTPTATPQVALRPPAQAILSDADVGLPREGGSDHLTLEQAAAEAPDQVLALQEFRGWGWVDAAQRHWGAGVTVGVTDLVVLTDRDDGARRAFAYLGQRAAAPPLAAGPCPAAVAGLDDCTLGTSGAQAVVVGRLSRAVFVLEVTGRDAAALAARQAQRLRAT